MEAYAHLLDRPGDIHVIQAEEFITSAIHQMRGMRNGPLTQRESNVDPDTGIRHGVISQHSIMEEAMDDFYFQYPKSCPYCGEDDSYKLTDLGFDEYRCDSCKKIMPIEEMTPDEPISFYYDQDGYFLTNCLDNGDILVLRSNFYTLAQFSPRESGAGNLDTPVADGVETYCLGHDWFEGGIAPYPVYRVSDNVQIVAAKVEIVSDQCKGTGKDTLQRITEVREVSTDTV